MFIHQLDEGIKIMKRIVVTLAFVAALTIALGGCGDDVKTVKKSERIEESPPQMVSPGQEVVE